MDLQKTIKSFLLVLMAAIIPLASNAQSYNLVDYLKFQVIDEENREAALTGYYEALGVSENFWGVQFPIEPVVIPSVVTIDGKEYTVTEIADNALYLLGTFSNPQRYEEFWPEIILPETIRRLGKRSLWTHPMYSFTKVNLPHSLEEMADSCLLTCSYGGQYTMLENVNSIGKNVFQGPGVGVLTFMNHDFELNANMFNLSYIQVLTLWGENLSIAAGTFNGTSYNTTTEIERLVFGLYPCNISSNAFGGNTSIDKIVLYSPNPYDLPEDAFSSDIYQNTKLLVPRNALHNYKHAPGWKNFVNIESINRYDVNYDSSITASDVTTLYNFMLNGDVECLMSSDVNDDGYATAADVTALYNYLLSGEEGDSILTYTANGVSFNMVSVNGGTFTMGDNSLNNATEHLVTLSSFYIGQTEVTQELWLAVMGGENPSWCNGSKGGVDYGTNLQRPVENVTWEECQEFISNLNLITGEDFRMPTEAEWEYAARGGDRSQGYIYAGSNNVDDVAWYFVEDVHQRMTHSVALKLPNELGLYDMSGNAGEWCQDWYGAYSENPQTNPTGPTLGVRHIIRGGAYNGFSDVCTTTYRLAHHQKGSFGLRLVR